MKSVAIGALLTLNVAFGFRPPRHGVNESVIPASRRPDGVFVYDGDIYVTSDDLTFLRRRWLENGRRRGNLHRHRNSAFQRLFWGNFSRPHESRNGRHRRAVSALPERRWPNATIPYIFSPEVSDMVKHNIFQAMSHWERHTCLEFVNRTTEDDFIEFEPGSCGCCSYVGRKGGRQSVTLTDHCAVYGVVVHELGHVVGFWHEHSRNDREKYIRILRENIMDDKFENFDKKSQYEIDSLGQPYDYYSIMHYRRKTFSKNGKNTVEPRLAGARIGQRDSLSPGDIVQARLLYNCPKPKCYEEYTSWTGNFSSPNYPVNYFKSHDCTWIIHLMPGELVTVEFLDFAVEASANCSFDYVEIREGIDETGHLIGRLCGEGETGQIESPTSIWIRFHSDASIAERGFLAHFYKTMMDGSGSGSDTPDDGYSGNNIPWIVPRAKYRTKCNNYLTARQGSVSSPLIPAFLSRPIDCSWTIDGGVNASRIQVKIVSSPGIPKDVKCLGEVYQRVSELIKHHKKRRKGKQNAQQDGMPDYYYVDRYTPIWYNCRKDDTFVMDAPTIMFQWTSRYHQPFKMSYVIDYDECRLSQVACQHTCHNTVHGFICTCRTGYQLQEDGQTCSPKVVQFADRCGTNMTSTRGKIRAGTEPLTDCFFYIRTRPNFRLFLTFSKWRLGNDVINDTLCGGNYVELLIGENLHPRGRFCGEDPPGPITSPAGLVALKVHSELNSSASLPYFSAKYIAYVDRSSKERCFHRLKASGNITSPGFPENYADNEICTWRISARDGHVVHMKFDVMDIEHTRMCNFDYLEVRNGKHRTSQLIGRFCGSRLPRDIVSTGRHVWLMFISDGSGVGRGFRAYLESQPDPHKTSSAPSDAHNQQMVHSPGRHRKKNVNISPRRRFKRF